MVLDHNGELSRDRRLHIRTGQRIVAQDVALHEVMEHQIRAGVHRKGDARELDGGHLLVVGIPVGDRAAEGVGHRHRGRGTGFRDEEELHDAMLLRRDLAGAGHIAQVGELLGVDLEQPVARHAIGIGDQDVNAQRIDTIRRVAIEDVKCAGEGLPCHGHRLAQLHGDGGADGRGLEVAIVNVTDNERAGPVKVTNTLIVIDSGMVQGASDVAEMAICDGAVQHLRVLRGRCVDPLCLCFQCGIPAMNEPAYPECWDILIRHGVQ